MRAGIWKHKNCLDVAFWIAKKHYNGPDYIKLKGYWVNKYRHDWVYSEDRIKILRKDLTNWIRIA